MSYLTTQRAHVFCFCYSEVCSVALSLTCFYVSKWSRFEGMGVRKDGAWHWATSLYCCPGCCCKSQKWNKSSASTKCHSCFSLHADIHPMSLHPNYVALPKGMIIISSGAKMTHLHLLFETNHILSSSLEMRWLAHLHLLPIIFGLAEKSDKFVPR